MNDSATVNGEVDAVRDGLPIVLHAAGRLDDGTWVVELRTSPDAVGADPRRRTPARPSGWASSR